MFPKDLLQKKVFMDIRFWIILFFIIRLWGITNPPLEVAHNWRQTTVTMVARNYFEVSPDILYPRVDFAGDKTGITGMEFPVLNYLTYLVSLIFGYTHWYGRLINLIISSLGIFYFYRIILKYFDKNLAFYSSLVLMSSIWFAYSRKIMPDTFSMSLTVIGFYFGTNFFDMQKNKIRNLMLYFLLTLLGIISKLPSGYILLVFVLFFIDKNIYLKLKIVFFISTIILLVPVCWWYFYWVPFLVNTYGFWHFFMGKGIIEGSLEIFHNVNDTLAHFYDYALKYIGFGFFMVGLFLSILKKNKKILSVFLLGFVAFLIVILKAGFTFSHHSYYIVPFVPVMALVCGFGILKIANRKIMLIIISAIILEGILNQQHEFFLKEKEIALVSLEKTLDSFSDRNDLIAINSNDNPTPMYFSHHKGWIAANEMISDKTFVNSIKEKGCKYIVILKQYLGTNIDLTYEKVFDNEHYTIYRL